MFVPLDVIHLTRRHPQGLGERWTNCTVRPHDIGVPTQSAEHPSTAKVPQVQQSVLRAAHH